MKGGGWRDWLWFVWCFVAYVLAAVAIGLMFAIWNPSYGADMLKLKKGDVDLLARVIWAEARSESFEGQCAVAWVILNRLAREPGRFPNTLQGVIKQPYAFSCFNTDDPQCERVKVVTEQDPTFVEAMHAATAVLTGRVSSPIGKADHYYVTSMKNPPAWARKMTLIKRVGAHSFFSEKP